MKDFDHDMISRYLDGEMNAEERLSFEEEIKRNEELRNEVALTREVNQTLAMKLFPDENEKALSKTMDEMRDEFFADREQPAFTKTKVVRLRPLWMAVAAAALVMVYLTVWPPWKKDLYQQYSEIEMPGVAERGSAPDSLLMQAIIYFNKKKFEESLPLFDSILTKDPRNSFCRFYYAVALLESNETGLSRIQLRQLYSGTSIYKYDAAFYIALSYLKDKNNSLCREWLAKIPADAAIYKKAQELLEKLR